MGTSLIQNLRIFVALRGNCLKSLNFKKLFKITKLARLVFSVARKISKNDRPQSDFDNQKMKTCFLCQWKVLVFFVPIIFETAKKLTKKDQSCRQCLNFWFPFAQKASKGSVLCGCSQLESIIRWNFSLELHSENVIAFTSCMYDYRLTNIQSNLNWSNRIQNDSIFDLYWQKKPIEKNGRRNEELLFETLW